MKNENVFLILLFIGGIIDFIIFMYFVNKTINKRTKEQTFHDSVDENIKNLVISFIAYGIYGAILIIIFYLTK